MLSWGPARISRIVDWMSPKSEKRDQKIETKFSTKSPFSCFLVWPLYPTGVGWSRFVTSSSSPESNKSVTVWRCKTSFRLLFLVGAFLVKRARLLQWLVFVFRHTTDLIVYVPLFTETTKTTQAKSGQSKLSAKGPPFIFFTFFT